MSSCSVVASADGVGHSGLVLYVNGEYRDDSDIGKLMHDFNCISADDMNFEILAEKTRYLKENPRFTAGNSYRMTSSSGGNSNGSGGNVNASINDAIRMAARR